MKRNSKSEVLKYYKNAKEILKKAEPDYETGTYNNIKYVQEAFGTLWLAILKAIDYALIKTGKLEEKDLPQKWETYELYIDKYLRPKNGKLKKWADDLYHDIHITGYYRGGLRGINPIKEVFKLAKKFIDKIIS